MDIDKTLIRTFGTLLVAALVLTACGRATGGLVGTPQPVQAAAEAASTPAPTQTIQGEPVSDGCGQSAMHLPKGTFIPIEAQLPRVHPEGPNIRDLPQASVGEARQAGFRALVPHGDPSMSLRYAGYDKDQFYAFVANAAIGSDEGLNDFYARGGIEVIERPGGAQSFRDRSKGNMDRLAEVAIGDQVGYVRHDDEVAKGVRPYLVMWTMGDDYFLMFAGVSDAATAVNQARSMVCLGLPWT
jgi:hypothetical protein